MLKPTKLLLLSVFMCLGITAHAQQQRVYLKNGGVVRGTLLKVDKYKVLISIDSANQLELQTSAIRGIRLRKRTAQISNLEMYFVDSLNWLPKSPKVQSQFSMGFLYGHDGLYQTTLANLSIEYAVFRRSSGSTAIGFGIGLDYYPTFRVMPFFFEYRKYVKSLPSGFFFYGRFGLSLASSRRDFEFSYNSVRGDDNFGLGFGQQWSLGPNDLILTMGFKQQSLRTVQPNGAFESFTNWNLNRLAVRIGLTF